MRKKTIIVTGGSGFIGSALIRYLLQNTQHEIINIDKLTYAGNQDSLQVVAENPRYHFIQQDICNRNEMDAVFKQFQPHFCMHLAAESHVDRSIDGPDDFIQTNIVGTYALLEAARKYWQQLSATAKQHFRFHHISTDEVYGALGAAGMFTEATPYDPSSPYSASKASSDHLVRAWQCTFGLPIIITNCSNNYGPYQFPEKLIPLVILNALEGKPLPIYGKGDQIRDWLYVDDHAHALYKVVTEGVVGETYNIGGQNEKNNLEVVKMICAILDKLKPAHSPGIERYAQLITHVQDRPGHDQRYAIDASKIRNELDWEPQENFTSGIRKTVQWYLDNPAWWQRVQDGSYQRERLGLTTGGTR